MNKLLHYYITNIDTANIFQFLVILGQNWNILQKNITFCRLLVISHISYYELPIGKSLHCCILTNKYNIFSPNFSRLLHWLYLFNPKQLKKSYNSQALSDSSIENTPLP